MSAASAKPKRRWWVRVLRGAFLLLLLLVLLLSAVLWWAYTKRVELLNSALAEAGPLRGEAAAFEVTRSGGIELRDLVFTDRATGATVARLPRITAQANFASLPPDEITSVTLHEPEITLTSGLLEAWSSQAAKPSTGSSAPPIPYGIRFMKADIERAKLRYEQRDATCAEVTLSYHAEDLTLQTGGLNSGSQELIIEDATVKPDGGNDAPFALKKLQLHGRIRDGIVELDDIRLDQPALHVKPELLAMLGLDLAAPAPGKAAAPGPPQGRPASPALLRGVRIAGVALRDFAVRVSGFTGQNSTGLLLPDTQAVLSYEAGEVAWSPGAPPVTAAQRLELRGLRMETPGDAGHLRVDSAVIALAPIGEGRPWVIEELRLAQPDVRWTPALRRMLPMQRNGAKVPPPANSTPPAQTSPPATPALLVKQASISGAKVTLADADLMAFELHTRGALLLADLRLDGDGLHSQSFQTLELSEGRLVFPPPPGQPARKPWLELATGELVVKPDDWNARTRLARLNLNKLVVRMREGNTPWDSAGFTVQGSEPGVQGSEFKVQSSELAPSPPLDPWWKRISCGQLVLKDGAVDMVLSLPKPVDMQAQVDISTQRVEDGGSQHTVRVSAFTAKLPTLNPMPFPVAQAALLEGSLRLPQMWTTRRFDELHLSGASVDFGETLLKLFEPEKTDPAAATTPLAPQTESLVLNEPAAANPKSKIQNPKSETKRPWHVGHLSVQQSAVTLSNVVPGMPAVKFGVAFDVEDTPLLAEDLVDDIAPQRIELHDLKIPSPNGTARYVAELDSIFVNFTLEGLMRKEIEGVEIVSPTLFVGEDLFWYVDFYRKYAERGAHPAKPGPQIAAKDDGLDFELADAVVEAEPAVSQASWSVKRLQVHSGKLVLAPKGVPLKGFRTPFPFHIDTEVKRGTLNADLDIPPDTYELPDVNLQFVGMKGRVQFNLPLKQKDNNLVETFEVDSIRWKQLRTGKAFLSVTYDSAGIYAKFGAEAYEGYINGEFNLYTDDSFHWDGWLGGKDVQTHDLTRILCPGYFLMDGRVEATLVAQGSREELYQADGSFKNHTPGKFSINALNGLLNDLPQDWDPLKAQLTKIGLETLRDFEYDHAEMKCRFYGREGTGRLSFSGPHGSRNFDINVYDHRWKDDGKVRVTRGAENNDE